MQVDMKNVGMGAGQVVVLQGIIERLKKKLKETERIVGGLQLAGDGALRARNADLDIENAKLRHAGKEMEKLLGDAADKIKALGAEVEVVRKANAELAAEVTRLKDAVSEA